MLSFDKILCQCSGPFRHVRALVGNLDFFVIWIISIQILIYQKGAKRSFVHQNITVLIREIRASAMTN